MKPNWNVATFIERMKIMEGETRFNLELSIRSIEHVHYTIDPVTWYDNYNGYIKRKKKKVVNLNSIRSVRVNISVFIMHLFKSIISLDL